MMIKAIQRIGSQAGFLAICIVAYAAAALVDQGLFVESLAYSAGIFVGILPVMALVFGMMFLSNLLLDTKRISSIMGKGSGIKGWAVAIAGGILSAGPIYMWFPLLSDLKEKGMKYSLIAAFLYNRAVKIPLMPLMIVYFGWEFTAVLALMMMGFSVINGVVVEMIIRR
jgi:uncharacterized membrane protein YraQ (UPF0718 family)